MCRIIRLVKANATSTSGDIIPAVKLRASIADNTGKADVCEKMANFQNVEVKIFIVPDGMALAKSCLS